MLIPDSAVALGIDEQGGEHHVRHGIVFVNEPVDSHLDDSAHDFRSNGGLSSWIEFVSERRGWKDLSTRGLNSHSSAEEVLTDAR